MSAAPIQESRAFRNLRELSEARGLKFYLDPPPDVVPEFLKGFRPDAIAVGPGGGIVIEVMRRGGSLSERQLADIAKKVSGQEGWEFRAIYLNSPPDEVALGKPTPEQLGSAFNEAQELLERGHTAAALVMAWATLESIARLASSNGELRTSASTALQPIQFLAEQGYLENDVADRLRALAKLRNAVVHGDLSVKVRKEQVEDLLRELRATASELMSVASEASPSSAGGAC